MKVPGMLLIPAIAMSLLAVAPSAASAERAERECRPPADTFYYSLNTVGVRCSTARRVLTHARCTNLPKCSKLRYRSWSCRVEGGIHQRRTLCSSGLRRILAYAAGD